MWDYFSSWMSGRGVISRLLFPEFVFIFLRRISNIRLISTWHAAKAMSVIDISVLGL